MEQVMRVAGHVFGGLGLLICAAAGAARVSGAFYILNTEALSVFQGGMGLMVAACLLKLWALEQRKSAD
jgi:hypothetical protein